MVVWILFVPAGAAGGDLTLFGGFQNPRNLTDQGSPVETSTFGVFGVRYSNSRSFAHEETIAFAPKYLDSRSKALILNSNVLLQGPPNTVRPYLTFGLGTVMTFGQGLGDIGTKFAINYGLGSKFLGGRSPIGARIDYRRYVIPGVLSQTLKASEISFGVVFSN